MDKLTQMLSRSNLNEFLDTMTLESGQHFSIVSVQISRFGVVNSSLGGELADKIIVNTARRLAKTIPDAIKIARTHGDHFALLFDDNIIIADQVSKILDFLQRPIAVGGEIIVLSVIIGVARWYEDISSYRDILRASEIALQQAKLTKQAVVYYQHLQLEQAKQLHQVENELRVGLVNHHEEIHRALHNDEFLVYYQPVVNASNGRVEGCEALMRWNHPHKGIVSPAKFIPIAEQLQLMDVLGAWIIRRAILDAESWQLYRPDIAISINVSPTQFINSPLLLSNIEMALRGSSMAPNNVKFEVTESSGFMEQMRQTLTEIKHFGCKVALDDFGTGFSSLTQLNQLPLDYLKIDRSFISSIDSDDAVASLRSKRMTEAAFALSNTFGFKTIVEGIENAKQLALVLEMGAELIQGFYYSPPVPHDEILHVIQQIDGGLYGKAL